ncbi:MAG: hypothetical protein ACXVW7_16075 [Trebonia sp.]
MSDPEVHVPASGAATLERSREDVLGAAVIASATRWPPAGSWSRRTRAAPCAANRSAPVAPIPLAAPVMIPTRPRSRWSPGAARPMTMASASFGHLLR